MQNDKFKKRVLFIGIPDMAYGCLELLCRAGVNIVGVIGPKKHHSTYQQFKGFVDSLKLNLIDYESLKSEDLLTKIKNLNIDIAVVASFNAKIPEEFISSIKDGILNQHPSLLPNYRGGNPYSHVIINGEKETGITIHFMSPEFDEGDIIYQEKCPIEPNETMGTIFAKTNRQSAYALLKVLSQYEKDGFLPRKPQPDGDFVQAPNINTNDSFIDFRKSAVEIERFVRALNPYINALSVFRDNYVKIHKVSVCDDVISDEYNVGDIYKIKDNKIYIKTSKGAIVPEVLQFAAFFIGDVKDFIDIVNPKIGEHFGF